MKTHEEDKLSNHRHSKGPGEELHAAPGPGKRENGSASKAATGLNALGEGDAAEYIAGLLDGLKKVAANANLSFLAYLIGVALEEAREEKSRHS